MTLDPNQTTSGWIRTYFPWDRAEFLIFLLADGAEPPLQPATEAYSNPVVVTWIVWDWIPLGVLGLERWSIESF